jgi:hypothetical protein
MIKWLLTTIILALVVAVVTIICQSPALRAKSEKWLKTKTDLVSIRIKEVKSILASKQGARGFFEDKLKETGKQTASGKVESKSQKKTADVKTTRTAKTGVKPAQNSGATAVQDDQISDVDRKKLEQVLEKANQTENK